ncbi:hypothetical protein F441_09943, partial [Phytophthora nicotianae CJ01A1]
KALVACSRAESAANEAAKKLKFCGSSDVGF